MSCTPGGRADPLVSIIMATYNCVDTVQLAVESIWQQSYTHWEFIVCDDASTDGTFELLTELSRVSPAPMVVLRNPENRRLAYSLNQCLAVASGKLVARMDGDDVSEPIRLQRQVEYLARHPEYQLVGTAMRRFGPSGLADVVAPVAQPDRFTLRHRVPFFHATILTYREVYETVGYYTVSPRTRRGQDYDLWFRFFHAGFSGSNLPEPLYRVREDAATLRRRTARGRINAYRTTLIGYRLLGYPYHWYFRPTFVLLVKILAPFRFKEFYREQQKNRYLRQAGQGDLAH